MSLKVNWYLVFHALGIFSLGTCVCSGRVSNNFEDASAALVNTVNSGKNFNFTLSRHIENTSCMATKGF